MTTDQYYAELESQYMNGEIDWSQAGEPQHGEQARREAQALMMQVTGTSTIQEAMTVALGRPRLSAEPNETIRTRVPKPLLTQVKTLAKKRQTTVSQIVREAMTEYVGKMAA